MSLVRILLPASITAGLLLAAGCTVGPDYHRPEYSLPTTWASPTTLPANVPTTKASTPLPQTGSASLWWENFNDPELTKLVRQAVGSNLDVKQAEARVRQARAQRGESAAALWPTVSTSAQYTRSRGSSFDNANADTRSGGLYQAGFDASWELDVFGGLRRNVEAADADVAAAIEDRRDVLVTLTAEVATDYLQLRSNQQAIVIAKQTLDNQRHNADITRKRFNAGLDVSSLDLANAEAQMASTAAQIPVLESSSTQLIYAISVLLGQQPGALVDELSATAEIPVTPPAIPIGLPSDLLRRRPDIRRAEAQLHAAVARVGTATADLYPKFSLTGSFGTESTKAKGLGNWDNRFWSVGPAVSWPLFDAGQIRSTINVQTALEEQAVLTYTQSILTALQDVDTALTAYAKEQQHRQALTDTVIAYRRALDLATRLYTNGQTDFLNVVAAQGSLYSAENALVQSDSAVAADLVALYKALGGGWEEGPVAK